MTTYTMSIRNASFSTPDLGSTHVYNVVEFPNRPGPLPKSLHQNFNVAPVLMTLMVCAYAFFLLITAYPKLQPFRSYGQVVHKSESILDHPEAEGFLKNQVTSHRICTSDGESLYSWLMLPPGAYIQHEQVLTRSWSLEESREIALQILRSDPKAVLFLYLHGNADNVATEDRCAAYRNLAGISSKHAYVLAFDYRGFGRSTGSPTEDGLITDTVSVLSWIDQKLDIPRTRVMIVGQSLGCAVAVGAVHRVVEKDRYAEFGGMLLCAGFTDVAKLAVQYKLGESAPMLGSLTWSRPSTDRFGEHALIDNAKTEQRLKDLMNRSETFRISIMHAQDDDRTPWEMSQSLFEGCRNEIEKSGMMTESVTDLQESGNIKEVRAGGKYVRRVILKHGGHRGLMKWSTVAFEAARLMTAAGAID